MSNSKWWSLIGLMQVFIFSLILFSAPALFQQQAYAAGEVCANGDPAPCAEDIVMDGCKVCHSIQVTAGNRNGTVRQIFASDGTRRHLVAPRRADWTAVTIEMIGKGSAGDADAMSAWLNTNFCTNCNGPILSSLTLTGAPTETGSPTLSWVTSANGYADEAATSVVYYGTDPADVLLGAACTSCQKFEDTAMVASHSVLLTGLTAGTRYYVVHESSSALGTATYRLALNFKTLSAPGGGGGGSVCSAFSRIVTAGEVQTMANEAIDDSAIWTDGNGASVGGLATSPDGNRFYGIGLTGELNTFAVDPADGSITLQSSIPGLANTFDAILNNSDSGHEKGHSQIAGHPDGQTVYMAFPRLTAAATRNTPEVWETEINVIDVINNTFDTHMLPEGSCAIPTGLALSIDGSKAYVSCWNDLTEDIKLHVYDTATNTVINSTNIAFTLDSRNTDEYLSVNALWNAIAVSQANGQVFVSLATSDANNAVQVFDANGGLLDTIAMPGTDDVPHEMAVSPDGTTLAVGTNGGRPEKVYLFNLSDASSVSIEAQMNSVAYNLDGSYLYGVGESRSGRRMVYTVIDTATNTIVSSVPSENSYRLIVTPSLSGRP